jgi:hypothetical protein
VPSIKVKHTKRPIYLSVDGDLHRRNQIIPVLLSVFCHRSPGGEVASYYYFVFTRMHATHRLRQENEGAEVRRATKARVQEFMSYLTQKKGLQGALSLIDVLLIFKALSVQKEVLR